MSNALSFDGLTDFVSLDSSQLNLDQQLLDRPLAQTPWLRA